MNSNEWLDDIRRRIQETLIQAKRDELRDRYGMLLEGKSSTLPPEVENEWLDYVLEFERQFEQAKRITVRERIGNPPIQPLSALAPQAVEEAIDALLELLAAHGVVVDFLGEVEAPDVYRYLTEELLDLDMDDIRIEGMRTHFTYSTPEYDVQMWAEDFVLDVFAQEKEYFLAGLEHQPLFDMDGQRVTAAEFKQKIEAVWEKVPARKRFTVKPITTHVEENEGTVTAVITWSEGKRKRQVESFFRLQPSPYDSWYVVQTSFLDDMLSLQR